MVFAPNSRISSVPVQLLSMLHALSLVYRITNSRELKNKNKAIQTSTTLTSWAARLLVSPSHAIQVGSMYVLYSCSVVQPIFIVRTLCLVHRILGSLLWKDARYYYRRLAGKPSSSFHRRLAIRIRHHGHGRNRGCG